MNNFEIQENFLNQLAKAYDTYDVSLIDEFIAKNFNFSHIWQVSEMKGRDVFLCYLSIRLEEAKKKGLKVVVDKSTVVYGGTDITDEVAKVLQTAKK